MNIPIVSSFRPRAIAQPGDMTALCRAYLAHLAARNYARNTLIAYRGDLEQFVGYLATFDVSLIQVVSTRHLDGFVEALIVGEGNKPRTAARKLEVVKGLFAFAVRRQILTERNNPCQHVAPIRFHTEPPIAPEAGHILAMIASIPQNTPEGVRDRAMFRLMFDSALRIGALRSLDVYDAAHPPTYTVRPSGVVLYEKKGGAVGESVCDDTTLEAIDRWLAVRVRYERRTSPPALFLSVRGTRMTRQAIHQRLKMAGKDSGLPGIHAHLLRHRRAAEALERGDIYLAHYLLGHKRMSTTVDMYGAQSRQKLRARIRRECPVDGNQEVA